MIIFEGGLFIRKTTSDFIPDELIKSRPDTSIVNVDPIVFKISSKKGLRKTSGLMSFISPFNTTDVFPKEDFLPHAKPFWLTKDPSSKSSITHPVISELSSNSCKYSPILKSIDGRTVTFTVSATLPQDFKYSS